MYLQFIIFTIRQNAQKQTLFFVQYFIKKYVDKYLMLCYTDYSKTKQHKPKTDCKRTLQAACGIA